MPVTEVQELDIYNILEDTFAAMARADTNLKVEGVLGRIKNEPAVEARMRADIRDYKDVELPAIAIIADNSTDADAEAEGILQEIEFTVDMKAWVIDRGADLPLITKRLKKATAIFNHLIRRQIETAAQLNVRLGGNANEIAKSIQTQFLRSGEPQNQIHAVVAEVRWTTKVDLCLTL